MDNRKEKLTMANTFYILNSFTLLCFYFVPNNQFIILRGFDDIAGRKLKPEHPSKFNEVKQFCRRNGPKFNLIIVQAATGNV